MNATGLSVPKGSLGWWQERFKRRRVTHDLPVKRFGEEVLPFQDVDGLQLELIAVEDDRLVWKGGGVPEEVAIRGVHGVTAHEEGYEKTADLLTETLRFSADGAGGKPVPVPGGRSGRALSMCCARRMGRGGAEARERCIISRGGCRMTRINWPGERRW